MTIRRSHSSGSFRFCCVTHKIWLVKDKANKSLYPWGETISDSLIYNKIFIVSLCICHFSPCILKHIFQTFPVYTYTCAGALFFIYIFFLKYLWKQKYASLPRHTYKSHIAINIDGRLFLQFQVLILFALCVYKYFVFKRAFAKYRNQPEVNNKLIQLKL